MTFPEMAAQKNAFRSATYKKKTAIDLYLELQKAVRAAHPDLNGRSPGAVESRMAEVASLAELVAASFRRDSPKDPKGE